MIVKIVLLQLPNKECPVQIFLDNVPIKPKRKILRQFELFELNTEVFLRNAKFFKKVTGYEQYRLWEFRIQFDKVQYRILVHLASTTCYLVHAFIKKEQKTPRRHFELSAQRIETYIYTS